jgi:hypothetical protein
VLWTIIGIFAWHPLVDLIARWLGDTHRIAANVLAALMFAALAVASALVAIAVLAMPVIVRTVAQRHFPGLEARHGGTMAGSAMNATFAILLFLPLWLAALLLLAIPPLYAAASLLLNAWLQQRMFRYDALAEHASADEIATLVRRRRGRLFGLGLALAPLSLIPVFNLLVLPLYAGIAFAELCLAELVRIRGQAPRTATA